ncbi:hypothetical protein BBK82_26475 [Lentzea guizhouensis]|uniref:Uncharacterized protein n=1 Tax=Lentzea guizhouensis TaxID=1586287 RepID=A0A1B2HMX6_9PSEU|nr:hypothetical protein BBK82_26475 [Lentzea guizhouensis]
MQLRERFVAAVAQLRALFGGLRKAVSLFSRISTRAGCRGQRLRSSTVAAKWCMPANCRQLS